MARATWRLAVLLSLVGAWSLVDYVSERPRSCWKYECITQWEKDGAL